MVSSIDKQVSIYMQGAEFGDPQIKEMMTGELKQRLIDARAEGRPLRVYCGYDVTAPDIHLGHTITMRKLRQFQDFGHEVIFLIGTFTTLIGDPSDRDEARAEALLEEVRKNAETYAGQAFKILDPKKTKIQYNYEWLSKLTFSEVISMASFFTVQQFLIRDRLRNRYEKNDPIWLRELLYPLAQGYDAVHLQADVQLGATEQLFNLMAGRKLQEVFGQKPQVCLTYPVLVGTDGVHRMSKTRGNYIGVAEPPQDIYGKTMSIPDNIILEYFELLTDVTATELNDIKQQLDSGTNPMTLKKRLAREIVTGLYGEKEAKEAEEHFEKTVQKKERPDDIDIVIEVPTAHLNIKTFAPTIVIKGLAKSNSEVNRLFRQGAISIDEEKITNENFSVKNGSVLKVGKRQYARLVLTGT
jgi:tyrosyl-tRNA synthetase